MGRAGRPNGLVPKPRRPKQLDLVPGLSEQAFQKLVMKEAKLRGWMVSHCGVGTMSNGHFITPAAPGFPDLVCVRPPRILFLELKRSPKSVPTPNQVTWINALHACGGVDDDGCKFVEAYVVHPGNARDIFDALDFDDDEPPARPWVG